MTVGCATLLLLIALFLPWYGISAFGVSLPAFSAVDVHGWMYLAFIVTLAILGYLLARAMLDGLRLPLPHAQALIGATGLALLLTVICFLVKPEGTSWSYGAFVGLIAALAALGGALLARSEEARSGTAMPPGMPTPPIGPFSTPPPARWAPPAPAAAAPAPSPASGQPAPTAATPAAVPRPAAGGQQTPTAAVQDEHATISCASCGRVNPAGNRFCNACGTSLESRA